MYKSPIEIITKDLVTKQEDGIYQAVLGQGVVVDKDELIRALQYDRGQYEKGYADGYAAARAEIDGELSTIYESLTRLEKKAKLLEECINGHDE